MRRNGARGTATGDGIALAEGSSGPAGGRGVDGQPPSEAPRYGWNRDRTPDAPTVIGARPEIGPLPAPQLAVTGVLRPAECTCQAHRMGCRHCVGGGKACTFGSSRMEALSLNGEIAIAS